MIIQSYDSTLLYEFSYYLRAIQLNLLMSEQSQIFDFRATMCGPFDQQYRRKFLGRQSVSLSVIKQKILKAHDLENRQLRAFSQQNLLPKIKEIEKITKESKSGKRKKVKLNQYVDGVSDLELYIAKKLISQKSTQEIMAKLQKDLVINNPLSKTKNRQQTNASEMYAKTDNKFYQANPNPNVDSEAKPFKTSYNSERKWVSDNQFNKKFDKFIIVKNKSESKYSMKAAFGEIQQQTREAMVNQLTEDKQIINKIARKMIQDNNYESQYQAEENKIEKSAQLSPNNQEKKNISWILKSCEALEKKFKLKKKKPLKKVKDEDNS